MNAKFGPLREQVQSLRHEGKSLIEISDALHTSKSTVSYWCRDITLSKTQQHQLSMRQKTASARGRLRAAELKRAQRIKATEFEMERGKKDVGSLSQRDRFLLGLALYWGEGYKKGNDECGLTNSDPAIILAFIEWLDVIYKIKRPDLILRVSINKDHSHRISAVLKYWSGITGIPQSQFTSASLIKTSSQKQYKNTAHHFGTLRVKVRRGTALRRRIMGAIGAISDYYIHKSDTTYPQ